MLKKAKYVCIIRPNDKRKEKKKFFFVGKEMFKKEEATYRRRGRFEVPRKRRAGAPLRHWPVRRGLAPVKREDLL